jgi:hypothetical protein
MARWMTTSIARMSTGYGHGYGSDTDSVDSLDEVDSLDDVDDMDESSDMPSAGSSQNTWAYEAEDRGAMVANVTRPQKDQLPNPDKDRHALLLGSFSLPVKVSVPAAGQPAVPAEVPGAAAQHLQSWTDTVEGRLFMLSG